MPARPTPSPPRIFVLAGMPRAGTTYVYHAFAAHPRAFVPYRKELRFFSLNYHRGNEWYRRFFSQAGLGTVCIDTSPDYFMDAAAPARLRDFSPEIKVALAVRDPAAWAVSLHRQLGTLESRVPPFAHFLESGTYPDFAFGGRRKSQLSFALREGFVRHQLAAFREALGERLLLYDFAWFERDPLAALRTLESFLGLVPFFSAANLTAGRINASGRKSVRWMNYLSSRDLLVNLAGTIMPRKWLIALRIRMDQANRTNPGDAPAGGGSADLAIAREVLAPDIAYVSSLFEKSPALLGNGLSYGGDSRLSGLKAD